MGRRRNYKGTGDILCMGKIILQEVRMKEKPSSRMD